MPILSAWPAVVLRDNDKEAPQTQASDALQPGALQAGLARVIMAEQSGGEEFFASVWLKKVSNCRRMRRPPFSGSENWSGPWPAAAVENTASISS